jgi:hypothetical protein
MIISEKFSTAFDYSRLHVCTRLLQLENAAIRFTFINGFTAGNHRYVTELLVLMSDHPRMDIRVGFRRSMELLNNWFYTDNINDH